MAYVLSITDYIDAVAQEFQQKTALLRKATNIRQKNAESFSWARSNKFTAGATPAKGTTLAFTEAVMDRVAVTATAVKAYAHIDSMEEFKSDVNVQKEVADLVVADAYRKLDKICLDELATTANSITLPTANTLNKGGFIKIRETLAKAQVPMDGNVFAALASGAITDILEDTTLTSADYVNGQFLEKGYVPNLMGVNVIEHQDLPNSTGVNTNYVWHKGAFGLGISKDISVKIERRPDIDAWQVLVTFMAGAKIIRPEGVYKFGTSV